MADTDPVDDDPSVGTVLQALVKQAGMRAVHVPGGTQALAAIEEALAYKGVSVIISREICTLYAKGLKQLKARAFYVSDKCRNHRDCLNALGCPAFYLDGDKVCIDPDLCVGCAVCAQVCPENAILPLRKAG